MFEINVSTRKGRGIQRIHCSDEQCRIGRDKDNLVVLQGWKVAGVHAWLTSKPEGVFISDNKTRTGLTVNDKKVGEYGPLGDQDLVAIGDYHIRIRQAEALADPLMAISPKAATEAAESPREAGGEALAPILTQSVGPAVDYADGSTTSGPVDALYAPWRAVVREQLVKLMDLRRLNVNELSDTELRSISREAIDEIISGLALPAEVDREELARQTLAEAVGLGPLEQLLMQDDVSEIMVNSAKELFFEQNGRLQKSAVTFTDDRAVLSAIERIVAPLGRRIDESSPMVDARLADGSRVNAVIPPLSLKGPCITIRKFMKDRLTAQHLINFGSISPAMVKFIETAVTCKRNVVISGGTGSGKTTLLNMLSNFIPDDERIITVEDAAELKLTQPNLVALEARPPNQEGKGSVSIRDLVRNCLRMRPDRIVVGECRGGEALDMLQAMNTGHDGSLTTIHANSPRDCISRLEVLVLMSGIEMPLSAVREQISSAVNLIVQQTRFSCGSRRVTSIAEVTGVDGNTVQLAEIFRFRQEGFDERGKVKGQFEATGIIPEFYEAMSRRGARVDLSIFRKEQDHG
ncbi:ATPase, T2SS/T4P/T4SS family [Marinobacter salicampi]|uniref:ATPase, T2SS/T4P/T4SS family n=1 Tax=Marinobacter salicampi TaxID=435907 RepID=UPI00140D13A9|nr:ATPase, T2SS/T4P/T4SS family [Marinobacter salicampi]